jgi:hypothetical protein
LTHVSKHIGLFLLLIFVGSFISSSATDVYSAFLVTGTEQPAAGEIVKCEAGYMQSSDVLKISVEIDQKQDEVPDKRSKTLISNNCFSSLHLLETDAVTLCRAVSEGFLYTSLVLLSSQPFVALIAAPPRAG